ncbi:MAG: hypothetical protein MZV65_30080 [Chromatiales bacterium]|nr:hypothetical protein [Chromatiales bacterium]
MAHWQQVAAERYPNGLPKPYSDDPTQWLFHGHPQPATDPLQVAVARLLGYRWPAETDPDMELADEARAWIARMRGTDRPQRRRRHRLPPLGTRRRARRTNACSTS